DAIWSEIRASRTSSAEWQFSAADLAAHERAEQFPALAVEVLHLHLFDRRKVIRASVDLDARQQHSQLQILETGRLLHDVLAGEIIATLLKHLNQRLCNKITNYRIGRRFVAIRI